MSLPKKQTNEYSFTILNMKKSIILGVLLLSLTACKSSRNIEKNTAIASGNKPQTTTIEGTNKQAETTAMNVAQRVANQRLSKNAVTASAKVRLSGIGGKDLSVNGKLQMKRDNVIRISLRFLGMEVGVLEFTPQDVLVVDRVNKQYVRATYGEVSFLKQAGLDFYSLQSLFWNELFLPGQHALTSSDLKRFALRQTDSAFILTPNNTPKLVYNFYTNETSSLIERIQVKGKDASDKGEFAFTYADFRTLAGRSFPSKMDMSVSGTGKKDISLSLNLSSLNNDASFDTTTSVSAKYTRRSVKDVLGKLF